MSEERPFFSIALIVREFPYLASISLNSILKQSFDSYEVIVVIANLFESTIQMLESYEKEGVKVHREENGNLAYMMNQAISFSSGEYIQFFYPGDQYLFQGSLLEAHKKIQEKQNPLLFYCSHLERSKASPEASVKEISASILKKGKAPTRLHCCWFRKTTFEMLGNFDTRYQYRASFDLFCRIFSKEPKQIVHDRRVLVDYEYRHIPPNILFRYGVESFRLIHRYFGLYRALIWWFVQDRLVFIGWFLRFLRQAFWRT